MQLKLLVVAMLAGACSLAAAAPPNFRNNTCAVKLNGSALGTAFTPSNNSSLRNSIVFDSTTGLYHLWVLANNDLSFPQTSALDEFTHATSTDGLHFTSDSNLSYGPGSLAYTSFGASIDPPLDFVRGAFDTVSGKWKLLGWTENVGASVGQYNYNTSVNDLGNTPGNTAVVHQGPLDTPAAGNHVGAFGLVDGKIYLRVDGGPADGGAGQFGYVDGAQASTGAMLAEANLFNSTPYCWFIDPNCGGTDDVRTPAYVHNVGRTLRQTDGTLGTYYTFRDANTYVRLDKQIWYVESSDNGNTWSTPVGVFANGNAITINNQPLDANPGTANFSTVEAVQGNNVCRTYFSTQDASGNFVFVSATTGSACDALFADNFDGCG